MSTTNLVLTELSLGQASKEITLNEDLWKIDALTQGVIQDLDLTAPPAVPADGSLYLVATGGTGAWSGYDGKLAHYFNDSWHFYTLQTGWRFWIIDEAVLKIWNGATWETVTTII